MNKQDEQIIKQFNRCLKSQRLVERQAADHFLEPNELEFNQFVSDPQQALAFFKVVRKLKEINEDVFDRWSPSFISNWLQQNDEERLIEFLKQHHQQRLDQEPGMDPVSGWMMYQFVGGMIAGGYLILKAAFGL